jgi:hypothetical protein
MGNCCEVVDFKLEEILEAEDLNKTNKSLNFCCDSTINTSDATLQENLEDIIIKTPKIQRKKRKLKTIIEDNHEDIASSPFILKRVRYD